MRTRNAILVVLSCAACSQPYGDRLAPRKLPDLVNPDAGESRAATPSGPKQRSSSNGANPVGTGPGPAAPAPKFTPVPAAKLTEGEVFRFVDGLLEGKREKLPAVPVGATLVARLRYALCRMHLNQVEVVLPELKRLSERHPDNPVVWRLLGLAYEQTQDLQLAIAAYRRGYDADRKGEILRAPTLARALGDSLLSDPKRRHEGVQFLREEIAKGDQFIYATAKLHSIYKGFENYREAFAVLDAGLQRDKDSLELIFYKGLASLEIHQIKAGLALLQPLMEHPIYGLQAMWYVARAKFLTARFDEATTLLDRLLAREDLQEAEREQFRRMRARVAKANQSGKSNFQTWECSVILRGHPSLQIRRDILRWFAEQKPKVAAFGFKIAANSDNTVLRVDALRLLVPQATDPVTDLETGFSDADGKVRAVAAGLAAGLAAARPETKPALCKLVLKALGQESDAYAFRTMHGALQKLTGAAIEIPFGGAKDPVQRAAVVSQWRKVK